MTCEFSWTLICPLLLFVFVCPSVGGLGMLYGMCYSPLGGLSTSREKAASELK